MHIHRTVIAGAICIASLAQAYDQVLGFNDTPISENRTIDEIYQAALAEGGTVTCWHGGDAPEGQAALKKLFEAKFPGMTLNITADESKYVAPRIDRQLSMNDLYVDSVIIQTLQDYPRWKDEGALLKYKPLGFDSIYPSFREPTGAYYGVIVWGWAFVWNTMKSSSQITEFTDFLKPEYKDKLVLTYPNDDDAVLFQFQLIMDQYGISWFEDLLKQNPLWVRGTFTPQYLMNQTNNSYTATFTSGWGTSVSQPFPAPLNISYPTQGQAMSWPLTAAILKDAPHPEGAKLLHAYYLSDEYQSQFAGVTVRRDLVVPNQPFDPVNATNTDPTAFIRFMEDRARVERLRFYFESQIGSPERGDPAVVSLADSGNVTV